MTEKARKGEREEGREEERGREPGEREGSRRRSQAGVGRGQACRQQPLCRAAAGSYSRLGAPGPGEGERPLVRSMSFSDSSATFLLNEVNGGRGALPRGGRKAPLQARKRAVFGGDCSDGEGGKPKVRLRVNEGVRKKGVDRAGSLQALGLG